MIGTPDTARLREERALLVRFCARYTGDRDMAEDLAQQTLLEAWRHQGQLRDPEARRSWLVSIARNVCTAWGRSRGREMAYRFQDGAPDDHQTVDLVTDDFDLEVELERGELSRLLDQALALLPADTRDVLIRRYIEDSPQAEVAAYLGLSEGAVEARLHRGKLALKRILTNEMSDVAVSYGLVGPNDTGWQPTRVRCTTCGVRTLEGKLDAAGGRLIMWCRACNSPGEYHINSFMKDKLEGYRTYRPATLRVLSMIHEMFRVDAAEGGLFCPGCGDWLPIRHNSEGSIRLSCDRCDWLDWETWHSLTWSLPEARQFWREHPNMVYLGEREVEAQGSPAMVTGYRSRSGDERLEVVALRHNLKVLETRRTSGPR